MPARSSRKNGAKSSAAKAKSKAEAAAMTEAELEAGAMAMADDDTENASSNHISARTNAKRCREAAKTASDDFLSSATVTAKTSAGARGKDASTSGVPGDMKSNSKLRRAEYDAAVEETAPIDMAVDATTAAADNAGDAGGKIGGGAVQVGIGKVPATELAYGLIFHGLFTIFGDGFSPTRSAELLYQASRDGDLSRVRQLLDAGVGVDSEVEAPAATARKSGRPLLAACEQGHYAVAELLLDRGANVDAVDRDGRTALREASKTNHLSVVRLLLERGAAMNTADYAGYTPLHLACHNGNLDVARLLLDYGAAVFAADEGAWTPLHWACKNGHLDVARLLLDSGAAVSAVDNKARTSLHWACLNGHLDVARLLLDNGAADSAVDSETYTPLHWACKNGHLDVARLLLDNGAAVSAVDNEARTPLHWACNNGYMDVVRLFLDNGASVSVVDNQARTPLHFACKKNRAELAAFLVSRGADVHARNSSGQSPLELCKSDDLRIALQGSMGELYRACKDGDAAEAMRLLDAGVDVNCMVVDSVDYCGRGQSSTPLHAAVMQGFSEVATLLISRGANIEAADKDGCTPLHLACYNGPLDVVRLLLDNGAALSAVNKNGYNTPLHFACEQNQSEVATLLVSRGADLHARNSSGQSPLEICNSDDLRIALQGSMGELYRACKDGDAAEAMRLLDAGVDVNRKIVEESGSGRGMLTSPLHAAVMQGFWEVAVLLVSRGANMHAQNSSGQSPLELCKSDDLRIALQGSAGELYRACKDGDAAEAMRLLDAGVNVNCMVVCSVDEVGDGQSSTPLHAAVMQGFSELAALLVSRGADQAVKNSSGLTPLAARQKANTLRYRAVISCMVRANKSNVITEENYYLLLWLYRIRRASCARGLLIGFLRPDFLWSIYRPMMRSKKFCRTDGDIRVAVDLWCYNCGIAEERYGNISDWDVSSVTNMKELFEDKRKFSNDISQWDVSNVTKMYCMFYDARSFNQAIGDWDVSKVTDMNGMFYGARSFNKAIGDWDVSNVTDMNGMFRGAQSFNQDLTRWDMRSVRNTGSMFEKAEAIQADNKPARLR